MDYSYFTALFILSDIFADSLPGLADGIISDRIYFTRADLCHTMRCPIGAEIFLYQLQEQLLPENN